MEQRRIVAVEPRRDAQDAWTADLQRRMKRTVWSSGGCASWYLDEHGRNTTLWPRTTFKFRELLRSFDLEKYVATTASGATDKERVA
jgi:hypothetical protein